MNKAEKYADQIMRDEREEIASEVPTIFEDDLIERIYRFNDGAVVKYEWSGSGRSEFNHRFTLMKAPTPNPHRLKPGVIKEISY